MTIAISDMRGVSTGDEPLDLNPRLDQAAKAGRVILEEK